MILLKDVGADNLKNKTTEGRMLTSVGLCLTYVFDTISRRKNVRRKNTHGYGGKVAYGMTKKEKRR